MKKYAYVVYYSEEEAAWIANVPDIEYFSAFGKTATAAVKELEASLKNWYAVVKEENLPMPEVNFDPTRFEAQGEKSSNHAITK
jgi:predicted RNase H-like HicB family nuclease